MALQKISLQQLLHEYNQGDRDFSGTSLRGGSLIGKYLVGIDFRRCDLSSADLSRSDLSRAKIAAAELEMAECNGAILDDLETVVTCEITTESLQWVSWGAHS